jgi:hypothetical protein
MVLRDRTGVAAVSKDCCGFARAAGGEATRARGGRPYRTRPPLGGAGIAALPAIPAHPVSDYARQTGGNACARPPDRYRARGKVRSRGLLAKGNRPATCLRTSTRVIRARPRPGARKPPLDRCVRARARGLRNPDPVGRRPGPYACPERSAPGHQTG